MEDEEGILEVSATENSTTLMTVSTIPSAVGQFIHTVEFKRFFTPFLHYQKLTSIRVSNKEWTGVADALINEGVRNGELIVHDGNDICVTVARARTERRKLATRVIFLLNITKVVKRACKLAINLVVVDIPQGVESIGEAAFMGCPSLNTVSFPRTLSSIGEAAFTDCSSLENVDLLHTNLQELGQLAFNSCSDLKSMTIPDSL
ncbi:hypothetical protein TL16_g09325 [Triparma laevis f. inornata]|uniref:Uncharacterized protein n=1 Tax=Triparma laevis f. inornata TaxID=1714386 RepID=A0A9W7B712_9STRA|nr:hypothetical protein TL16_g09325 [Triparma laevis f. inornata]